MGCRRDVRCRSEHGGVGMMYAGGEGMVRGRGREEEECLRGLRGRGYERWIPEEIVSNRR